MSKGIHPRKLRASIKLAAKRLAKEDGVSLDQRISVAVAQNVSVVESAADFFRRRAGTARAEDLKKYLAGAPGVPPMPGDEIDP